MVSWKLKIICVLEVHWTSQSSSDNVIGCVGMVGHLKKKTDFPNIHNPKNHGISKLVVWRSQNPAIQSQNPLWEGPMILRELNFWPGNPTWAQNLSGSEKWRFQLVSWTWKTTCDWLYFGCRGLFGNTHSKNSPIYTTLSLITAVAKCQFQPDTLVQLVVYH